VWVGEWIASRKNGDEIVLATKYTSPYKLHVKGVIKANYGGNGAKSMRTSLETSLRNLQTTYIDLFYVHWWDYTTSIPEMMQSLNNLVTSGKFIYLGISDTPA
jgi:aryl-alcohol dehydrogenase-like predicted oxidoreductase